MSGWESAELGTASWPGATAPVSRLRPVPPRAPLVRFKEATCLAPPLVLPAAKTMESPTHSSQGSTGLGLSEGEDADDCEDLLPFSLDDVGDDAPKTGGYTASPQLERLGPRKTKEEIDEVGLKELGVHVVDKEVTFSLNVSPVLLCVLDQMAKEAEARGDFNRQQTI
mmetsp:Transcript_44248/g.82755  ORF Transcript_44248/g.82755 Transcript_44248/m.82755 type:complete len:168 (-) Transcript_44248:91-594(-)